MSSRGDVPNDMETNGELTLVRHVLGQRDTALIFDVGANLGEWTSSVLRNAPTQTSVHLFEPFPATFTKLKERTFEAASVTMNCMALSDEVGESVAYQSGSALGTNSLHRDPAAPKAREILIATTTLDQYLSEQRLGEVNYLKIDTEGHDLAVIRGAEAALTEGKVQVLQFEYNHRWVYSRSFLLDVFRFIDDKPYSLGKLVPKRVELYERWEPELERFFEGNYVLVRNDVLGRIPVLRGTFDTSNTYS